MTLRKRIDRLTTKTGGGANGPSVVFLCEAGGEAHVALVRDGGGVSREPHETEADFKARVCNGAGAMVLPDNGRDALATGNAPKWAQSDLTLRALREKHSPAR